MISVLFLTSGDKFFVETASDSDEIRKFPISYRFSHKPFQPNLAELDRGHIQALNVVWDTRAGEGGQRHIEHLLAAGAIV